MDIFTNQQQNTMHTNPGHNQHCAGPEVQVTVTIKFAIKKDEFLSNTLKKQDIINLVSEVLVKEEFKTAHVLDDADTLIARTALSCSKEKQVKLILEDTDILILLWHFINEDVHQVIFQSEIRTWSIQHLIDKTGHMKGAILLIYGFLGCDTVSRIYCIVEDKRTKSSKLVNIYCDVALIFYNHLSTELNIQETGKRLLLGIHNRVYTG